MVHHCTLSWLYFRTFKPFFLLCASQGSLEEHVEAEEAGVTVLTLIREQKN